MIEMISSKYFIIACIIVVVGAFGGFVKYLNVRDVNAPTRGEKLKYLLTGVGSALLVPLLLYMLSSDVIKTDPIPAEKFFIFSGFCFLASYFSDRFIMSIGEKVLSDLNKTKNKLAGVEHKQQQTDQAIGAIIESESEPKPGIDPTRIEDITKNILDKTVSAVPSEKNEQGESLKRMLTAFSGDKFRFRTIDGIAKEVKLSVLTTEMLVGSMEDAGLLVKVKGRDKKDYWGLTSLGKAYISGG